MENNSYDWVAAVNSGSVVRTCFPQLGTEGAAKSLLSGMYLKA